MIGTAIGQFAKLGVGGAATDAVFKYSPLVAC